MSMNSIFDKNLSRINVSKKRFIVNSASGWISHLVVVVVGFIMLPYVISRLGQTGYGVYLGQHIYEYYASELNENKNVNIVR